MDRVVTAALLSQGLLRYYRMRTLSWKEGSILLLVLDRDILNVLKGLAFTLRPTFEIPEEFAEK